MGIIYQTDKELYTFVVISHMVDNITPTKNIFLIQETWNGQYSGELRAVSNREIIWNWIVENGSCSLSRNGKPPKMIVSYKALCRCFEKMHLLPVMIIGTDNDVRYFNLIKLPVQTK